MKIKKLKTILITLILFYIFNITCSYATVSVGDSYGGGTVFCVSQTPDITQCVPVGSGDYGLIMANEDQVNFDSNPKHGVTWASKCDAIPAAQSDDDGAANTAAIIAALPEDNPGNNAAWLCHNYQGGGEEGWYLPSKNELYKMYLFAKAHNLVGKDCSGSRTGGVQCLVGGCNNQDMVYWSSTEHSVYSYNAWSQSFNGDRCHYLKVYHYFGVRPVRAFNDLAIQQFKQAIQTFVLGAHERVGEHSSVNLLGQHELQEIAKYLGQAVKISGFM